MSALMPYNAEYEGFVGPLSAALVAAGRSAFRRCYLADCTWPGV
jgi:hypothetical protein